MNQNNIIKIFQDCGLAIQRPPSSATGKAQLLALVKGARQLIERCALIVETKIPETDYNWADGSLFGKMTTQAANNIRKNLTQRTLPSIKRVQHQQANTSKPRRTVDAARKEFVNHPPHYGGKATPYETIKVIEAWKLGFCLGNTVKYISRAGKKDDTLQELEKAAWYLNREIENLKKKNQ